MIDPINAVLNTAFDDYLKRCFNWIKRSIKTLPDIKQRFELLDINNKATLLSNHRSLKSLKMHGILQHEL